MGVPPIVIPREVLPALRALAVLVFVLSVVGTGVAWWLVVLK
jgi:hypothetical protein